MKKKSDCTKSITWKLAQEKTKETYAKIAEKNKSKYYLCPRLCECCNSVIPYEKDKRSKFCSRSCAAKVNNQGVRRHGQPAISADCKHCGTPFRYKSSISRGKFCSNSCYRDYTFLNETLDKFKNNQLLNSVKTVKKCVIHLNGNVCVGCGNTGTHNDAPLVLQLDHIDGDSDNNSPSNLRLLCPNCHSQTPTYKSRNKNSSRAKYRRKYYNTAIQNKHAERL